MRFLFGSETVLRMFDAVRRRPERYRTLIVVTPFVDVYGAELLRRTMLETLVSTCVVTTFGGASLLVGLVGGNLTVTIRPALHAKLYLLRGLHRQDSAGIVTSANLTRAGLHDNVELGVHLSGAVAHQARAIDQLCAWASFDALRDLTVQP